jgi:hypothetical protein
MSGDQNEILTVAVTDYATHYAYNGNITNENVWGQPFIIHFHTDNTIFIIAGTGEGSDIPRSDDDIWHKWHDSDPHKDTFKTLAGPFDNLNAAKLALKLMQQTGV